MTEDSLERQKQRLRQSAKTVRQQLDQEAVSHAVRERVSAWPVFGTARVILLYAALPGEIDLLPLMERYPHKHWYLPRVETAESLAFHRVHPRSQLVPSALRIREPSPEAPRLDQTEPIDLILVPALMLDGRGIRLGFGRGYYDRFLASLPRPVATAGIVPESLLIEELPAAEWDVPLQWGITEERLLQFPLSTETE